MQKNRRKPAYCNPCEAFYGLESQMGHMENMVVLRWLAGRRCAIVGSSDLLYAKTGKQLIHKA